MREKNQRFIIKKNIGTRNNPIWTTAEIWRSLKAMCDYYLIKERTVYNSMSIKKKEGQPLVYEGRTKGGLHFQVEKATEYSRNSLPKVEF